MHAEELGRVVEGVDAFLSQHPSLRNTPEAAAFDGYIVSLDPLRQPSLILPDHVEQAKQLAQKVYDLAH